MDINKILPLIVPAGLYRKGAQEMPHHPLENKEFLLTWVAFAEDGVMDYLTQEEIQDLDDTYYDWQMQAFENLRLNINENEIFFTQHKMSNDGERILFIVFLHADGIGSSRVLFNSELEEAFPNGYYIAIPDKSCGLVIAKDVTETELAEITQMVIKTHAGAGNPLSPLLHNPAAFALPAEWTAPFDADYSEELINEIINLRIT